MDMGPLRRIESKSPYVSVNAKRAVKPPAPMPEATIPEATIPEATYAESSLVYILCFYIIASGMLGALVATTECLLTTGC